MMYRKIDTENDKCIDLSVAATGTWALVNDDVIEIHYPGLKEVKKWRPEGVNSLRHVFINNNYIFVGEISSPIIKSYNKDLVYVGEYDVGTSDGYGDILVTARGKLMKSSCAEGIIYTIDLGTNETSSFDIEGEVDEGEEDDEQGDEDDSEEGHMYYMCLVNNDDYILGSDNDNNTVNVFTHDGKFLHYLDFDVDVEELEAIEVLTRRGKPSLMAVYKRHNNECIISFFSLE